MMFNNLIKIRNKKKIPLLWSFICMLLCSSLLIGSTYAWFTSSVSSNGNRIQAGTLKVGLTYKTFVLKDSEPTETETDWTEAADNAEIFKEALYQPGSVSVTFFKVENKGSLALKYQLALLKNAETAGINVLGHSFMLSDYLTFDFVLLTETTDIKKSEVLENTAAAFTRENALKMIGGETTVGRQSIRFPYTTEHIMKTDVDSTTDIIALVVTMPSDAGMAAMYDDTAANGRPDLKLDFKLGATQYSDETDAFGSDYDSAAIYAEGWSQSKYIHGKTELVYYSDADGLANVPLVKVEAPTGDTTEYTMIVSECSEPVGIAIESGKRYQSYNITLLDSRGKPVSGDKVYEVTMYVGKYLDNVVLYHNGTPSHLDAAVTFEAADYNPATGYLRFTTTKFSAFTVVGQGAVVRMGDQVFKTIESAFEAVHTGTEKTAVITVMAKETEVTSALTVKAGENITLDLNGCTVKADVNHTITNKGTLTLEDSSWNKVGTLAVSGAVDTATAALIRNEGSMDIKNGTLAVQAQINADRSYYVMHNIGSVQLAGGTFSVRVCYGETAVSAANQKSIIGIYSQNGRYSMTSGSMTVYADKVPVYGLWEEAADSVHITGGHLNVCSDVALTNANQAATGIHFTKNASGSVANAVIEVTASDTAETSQGVAEGILHSSKGDVNISNVTIIAVSGSANGTATAVQHNSSEGACYISGGNYRGSGSVISNSAGTMTIDGGEYRADAVNKDTYIIRAGGTSGTSNPLTIKNAALIGETASGSALYGVCTNGAGAVVSLENCNITVHTASNKARGVMVSKGTISEVKNCKITVQAETSQSMDAFGIALESNAGDVQSVENCEMNITSKKKSALGIYNNSNAGTVTVKGGNTIKVESNGNAVVYAIFDNASNAGKIVDVHNQEIANVFASITCTWTGA